MTLGNTAMGRWELELGTSERSYAPALAAFVCRRLIQRFVSSNPTPDYLYHASKAFKDGFDRDPGSTFCRRA